VPWLLATVAAALTVRIVMPWSTVFDGDRVVLLETDAWYHLRAIEYLAHHFPHPLRFDPYASLSGQSVQLPPMLDYLAAGTAWVLGGGAPSTALTQTVAVLTPPVLAGLTVTLVYAVGRAVAGSIAGLVGAALAAIMPGHFLDRTLLGFVDHHALEACLGMLLLWLTVRLVQQPTTSWRTSVALGITLAVFRYSWNSAALVLAVLGGWFVLLVVAGALRRQDPGHVPRALGLASLVALGLTLPFEHLLPAGAVPYRLGVLALLAAAGIVEACRWALRTRRLGWPAVVAMALGAVGLVAMGAWWLSPSAIGVALDEFQRMRGGDVANSVLEVRPLLAYFGDWSWQPIWTLFGSGLILGWIGVVVLAGRWVRDSQPAGLTVAVWTVAMTLLTLQQNRFGYYLVPVAAVAGGIACAAALNAAGRRGPQQMLVTAGLVSVLVLGLNVVPAAVSATRPPHAGAEVLPAFEWLRDHTEEPFGDPGYFFARYDGASVAPVSTVMAWWDYGYIVTTVARRVPVALPTQGGAGHAGRFFAAQTEEDALALLHETRSQYVVVDDKLPVRPDAGVELLGKFGGIAAWAGEPQQRYFATFFVRQEQGGHRPIVLYFEDYYRTMTFRLGVLGGQGTAEVSTILASWTNEYVDGVGLAPVVTLQAMPSYAAATERLVELGGGDHRIVGTDPHLSPTPLEPLHRFTRVFATPGPGAFGQGAAQVFQVR